MLVDIHHNCLQRFSDWVGMDERLPQISKPRPAAVVVPELPPLPPAQRRPSAVRRERLGFGTRFASHSIRLVRMKYRSPRSPSVSLFCSRKKLARRASDVHDLIDGCLLRFVLSHVLGHVR